MPRNPGTLRPFRWCYRTLIMLVSVAMVAGLACAGSAQAAQAASRAPSAAALSAVQHAAPGMKETETTASNGDLTVDVDPGVSMDTTAAQQFISQIQNENPRLSDTILRMFQQGEVQLPAGTTDAYWDPASGWQDFDGTLALTSDGTGVSLTIPAAEVQTSATWLQEIAAAAVGVAVTIVVRFVCVAGTVALLGPLGALGQSVCAFLANFVGNMVRGGLLQLWDGNPLNAPWWANLLATAVIMSLSATAWELAF